MIQIKLERIGDDERWICSKKSKEEIIEMYIHKRIRYKRNIYLKGESRAWCAKIKGCSTESTLLLKRECLIPNISYLEANGVGSRGVYAFYNLENNNIYEINEPISWKKDYHYFCKVIDNTLIKIPLKEVFECLKIYLE